MGEKGAPRQSLGKKAPVRSAGKRPAKPQTKGAGESMKRLQSAASQQRHSQRERDHRKVIGLVPTMGAFHEGHISLMRRARGQCDRVVASIFVNPLQFGPAEDYTRYPRDLARDIDRASEAGVDVVFIPEVEEMYPQGFTTSVAVGRLATRLCGARRPGHFDGVCTVVMKLIGIVRPHRLYLGEKDRQQLIIIQRMIADLNVDVKVVACPTVRERDGLALSSRNIYLSPEERALAPRLYQSLRLAQREILMTGQRDPQDLRARMEAHILADGAPFAIEYIAMADPETLDEQPKLSGRVLIALAAKLGDTRLIDNILINVPGGRMAETVPHRGEHGACG
jgi:pantoate--beta-alanine ligase